VRRAAILALALAAASACPAAAPAPGAWWTGLGVRDLSGAPLGPPCRWIVVIALGQECPVSNAEIPELNAIAADFRGRGVAVVGAYVDPNATLQELRAHALDYRVGFLTADDRGQALARAAGAAYTPEAAVFGADGRRLYQGAIDDRFCDPGVRRPTATRHYLREVLDAVVSGAPAPFPTARGYGCALPQKVGK
jgi:hypothetical protein